MGKKKVKTSVVIETYIWLNNYALERGTSMSDVVRQWIEDKRDQMAPKKAPSIETSKRVQ